MPIPVNPLLAADDVVVALHRGLGSADHSLGAIPDSIQVVIRDRIWEDRIVRVTGEHARFRSFAEFVASPPLAGLGTTVEHLLDICRRSPAALDAIDRATAGQQGERTDLVDNVHEVERPAGNGSTAALRRLRKDRPDLHAEVLAGTRSPHGAMVAAGFRPRTVTVPVGRPDAAAAALLRHLSHDECQRVAHRLLAEDA